MKTLLTSVNQSERLFQSWILRHTEEKSNCLKRAKVRLAISCTIGKDLEVRISNLIKSWEKNPKMDKARSMTSLGSRVLAPPPTNWKEEPPGRIEPYSFSVSGPNSALNRVAYGIEWISRLDSSSQLVGRSCMANVLVRMLWTISDRDSFQTNLRKRG